MGRIRELILEVEELSEQGWTHEEIDKHLGCSLELVAQAAEWLKENRTEYRDLGYDDDE